MRVLREIFTLSGQGNGRRHRVFVVAPDKETMEDLLAQLQRQLQGFVVSSKDTTILVDVGLLDPGKIRARLRATPELLQILLSDGWM